MSAHQHDADCADLWAYFEGVVEWVGATFPVVRVKLMKGLPWGTFYNQHHERVDLDPVAIEQQVRTLLADPEVTKKRGVYEYVLTGDERCLNLRQFDEDVKHEKFEQQGHRCAICGETFEYADMEGDHITPWSKGGKTTPDNCRMLCADCNGKMSNKHI